MKEFLHKVVAGLILLTFCYVVYLEVVQPQSSLLPSSGAKAQLTLEDSERIYADLGGQVGTKPVIVFVTPWCGICRTLEARLQRLRIPHVRADIEADRKALVYYEGLTRGQGVGVPVAVVGSRIFHGYTGEIFSAIRDLYR